MARNAHPNASVDLELLDTYLMSADAPASSMGLSDLDGFLTGLAVGPELVMPSEWMPLIWGGDEPEFDTVEAANAILGTIMARYNEIVLCFDTDPELLVSASICVSASQRSVGRNLTERDIFSRTPPIR
jgi:yecA family protein